MVKIIGYSADADAYYRHGGEKPKRVRYPNPKGITRGDLTLKNLKPGKFKCCYCDVCLTVANFAKDHIIPLSRGGSNAMKNIRPCCVDCNTEKGNMMPETWLQYLELNNDVRYHKAKFTCQPRH